MGGRRIPSGMPLNGRKQDRDEDLLLFKELHRREKDRVASLLQPVSDEFEPHSGNSSTSKGLTGRPKSPNPIPNSKIPPSSVTPNQRSPSIPSLETKPTNIIPTLNRKVALLATEPDKRTNALKPATTNQKESQANFLTSNLNKNTSQELKKNPRSRGVSPSVRSTIPAQITGFSNETPPNLKTTNRATSATSRRPAVPANTTMQPAYQTKTEIIYPRANGVTRGRKESSGVNTTSEIIKGTKVETSNGTQVFGSRMVDKVMNARKFGALEKETKSRLLGSMGSVNGSSLASLGKSMSKSSLDMAFKHMSAEEIKRDWINSHHLGYVPGRSSTREQLH